MKVIQVNLTSQSIQQPRKIRAVWTRETQTDQQWHGQNPNQLARIIQREIAKELNNTNNMPNLIKSWIC